MTDKRPPIPPFTEETALLKVQAAEDAWNTRDPETIALAYTEDSQWRNRCDATTSVLTSGNAAPMHRSRPSRRAIRTVSVAAWPWRSLRPVEVAHLPDQVRGDRGIEAHPSRLAPELRGVIAHRQHHTASDA
ncbi:DUF1348 family protein [Actinacidiphila soli]|uniref:DUF1348 family protein n=1 Tax=Actinacidiphila soli TaxID=2487275 RepID=UPI001F0BABCE|nr:DUF1348 family protein [Actinacidiphila soli]